MSLISSLLMTVITIKAFHYHNHYYSTNNSNCDHGESKGGWIRGHCSSLTRVRMIQQENIPSLEVTMHRRKWYKNTFKWNLNAACLILIDICQLQRAPVMFSSWAMLLQQLLFWQVWGEITPKVVAHLSRLPETCLQVNRGLHPAPH